MQKEEKVMVVLLVMAIASLAVAYLTFLPSAPDSDSQQLSEYSDIGERVVFEGTVLGKRFTYTGDHLLLDVDYGSTIVKVFVPNSAGAMNVDSTVLKGDMIRISGEVAEYKGEREVVINSENDIVLL